MRTITATIFIIVKIMMLIALIISPYITTLFSAGAPLLDSSDHHVEPLQSPTEALAKDWVVFYEGQRSLPSGRFGAQVSIFRGTGHKLNEQNRV